MSSKKKNGKSKAESKKIDEEILNETVKEEPTEEKKEETLTEEAVAEENNNESGEIEEASVKEEKKTYTKAQIRKEIKMYRSYVKSHKRKERIDIAGKIIGMLICGMFAFLFLTPIVLTFTNSFMSPSEISSNYGAIFSTTSSGGKVYISKMVNLKFIPDIVTFHQYFTALLKSPAYLYKFWNSMIYVIPIVIFQLLIASLASYGFARYTGVIKKIISIKKTTNNIIFALYLPHHLLTIK